jgi:hypothetical protein
VKEAPAEARWNGHLHGLATQIHEESGLVSRRGEPSEFLLLTKIVPDGYCMQLSTIFHALRFLFTERMIKKCCA